MTYKVTNFLIDKTLQQYSLRSKDKTNYYPNLIKKNIMYYINKEAFKLRNQYGSKIKLKPSHFFESGKITKDESNLVKKIRPLKSSDKVMNEILKNKNNKKIYKKLVLKGAIKQINWKKYLKTTSATQKHQRIKKVVKKKIVDHLMEAVPLSNCIITKIYEKFMR